MLNPQRRPEEHVVIIGVPKEVKDNEYRVALTPEGACELTHLGHQVLVQASTSPPSRT
jgi:alanine dehydrogenase